MKKFFVEPSKKIWLFFLEKWRYRSHRQVWSKWHL